MNTPFKLPSAARVRRFAADNVVVLIFLFVTAIAVPSSKLSGTYIIQDLLTRYGRNAFLVFSLLLPIMAGMGINFGMVLGAMAGEIGLIFAVDQGIAGVQGLLYAVLVGAPIAILLGWIAGRCSTGRAAARW